MSEPINWQSSVLENRVAWVVASLCLLLIAVAALKPDLFELPSEPEITVENNTVKAQNKAEWEKKQAYQPPAQEEQAALEELVAEIQKPAVINARTPVKAAPVAVKKIIKKPAPITKPAPTKTSAHTASGYYVQLGAFGKRLGAQGQVDQLKKFGWDAVVFQKPGGLFAVWAGPTAKRTDAVSLQKSIERKMKSKGFIVYHKES